MKVMKAVVVTAIVLGLTTGISAQGMQGMHSQMGTQEDAQGMMGGSGSMMGMMEQMHGNGVMNGMSQNGGMMSASTVPSVRTILAQSTGLNLSAEQTQTLQTQQTNLQKQIISLEADLQIAGINLRQALTESELNQRDVEKSLEARNTKKLEIQQTLLGSYFTGLDVLTAEQQEQVVASVGGCTMMEGVHAGSGQEQSEMGSMMPLQNGSHNATNTMN